MSSSTAKNLEAIVKAVEQHDANCESKAKAVLLSPYEHDRLGFDSISVNGRSVPIKADDSLGTGRLRVLCDGYHGPKREEEVEDTVEAPSTAERELVPAGMPSWDTEHEPGEAEADFWGYTRKAFEECGREKNEWPPTVVTLIGGRRAGKTMEHERFRRWVGEWHPEIAIVEIRPGVVTYQLP